MAAPTAHGDVRVEELEAPPSESRPLIQNEERVPAPTSELQDAGPELKHRILGLTRVLIACTLYLLIGPSLIIVNRTLLKDRQLRYPMMISGLGLLFSSAVSALLIHCRCVHREHLSVITLDFFLRNLLPIGAALACTLAAGNAVYVYLPVGFIQMLKAFTPTVTLTMLWATGIEQPTVRVLLSVLGICAGTAIASLGEGSWNLIGLGLMLAAEVAEATRLVLTQKLLKNLKFGVRTHTQPCHRWYCGCHRRRRRRRHSSTPLSHC